MNNWLQFLAQHDARLSDENPPRVLNFGDESADSTPITNFAAPLTELGLIAVSGDEAAQFLHNQITNDVEHLGPGEARLAGYCTPKGRLLATMLMWKTADVIMLQLPRQIQPAIQKRLQMFVLRAKAKLADASDQCVTLGLAGPAASEVLTQWFPILPAAPYGKVNSDAGTLIREADALGAARYQWVTTPDVAQTAWPTLIQTLQPVGAHAWKLSAIEAGVPQITAATQEQFVPQMINYEVVGGVNFKKGCYPGQEIVARSQYLGKLKRRMMLASIATHDARPGIEVFSDVDPDQPCGMIVNAEASAVDTMTCLVELKLAAMDAGAVHLGSANGPVLHFKPLPYEFIDPTE